jgi:hypothetical protein
MPEKDGFEITPPTSSGDQSSMPLSSYNPQTGGGLLGLLQSINVDSIDRDNLKAIGVGLGAAATSKYLSADIPPIVRAMAGAGLAALLGEKLLGPSKSSGRRKKR